MMKKMVDGLNWEEAKTVKYFFNLTKVRLRGTTYFPYRLFIKVTYSNLYYTTERYTLKGKFLSRVTTNDFSEAHLVDCTPFPDVASKFIRRIQMYSLFNIKEITELA